MESFLTNQDKNEIENVEEKKIEKILFDLFKKDVDVRRKSGKTIKVTLGDKYYIVTSSFDDGKFFIHVFEMLDQGSEIIIKEWKKPNTCFALISEAIKELK